MTLDEVENCLKTNYNLLEQGIIPKSYVKAPLPQIFGDPFKGDYTFYRDKYIERFGFPLFAEDWVKPLAKWIGKRPCLEIIAGSGYFSYALSLYGCNIKATDNYSWASKLNMDNKYFPVEKLDALEAIKKYGKDVKFIICSWPYMNDLAYLCLMKMREVNPSCRMIYVGENYGGCCANTAFFDALEYCEVEGFYKAVDKYRRWQQIEDSIMLIK